MNGHFIIAGSHDWSEFHNKCDTVEDLESALRADFGIPDGVAPWTEDFWEGVTSQLDGPYKSFQILRYDAESDSLVSVDYQGRPDQPSVEELFEVTVIFREVTSPLGQPYPRPLLYVLNVADPYNLKELTQKVAEQRFEDLDGDWDNNRSEKIKKIAEGIEVCLVFEDDIGESLITDWRQ